MEELLSDIQFAKPLFLWLLLGLPLLWVRARDQRLLIILARTIIFLLLVLGLPFFSVFSFDWVLQGTRRDTHGVYWPQYFSQRLTIEGLTGLRIVFGFLAVLSWGFNFV